MNLGEGKAQNPMTEVTEPLPELERETCETRDRSDRTPHLRSSVTSVIKFLGFPFRARIEFCHFCHGVSGFLPPGWERDHDCP
jgi:hypothetical protein